MVRFLRVGLAVLVMLTGSGLAVAVLRSGSSAAPARWVAPARVVTPTSAPTVVPSPSPPAPTASAPPLSPRTLLHDAPVKINSPGFWSWALLDTGTGKIVGAKNLNATSTTASMIKAWISADFLRRSANPPQAWLDKIRMIIRDSHNPYAEELFELVGESASIGRLISTCKLTDTKAYKDWWSNTTVSARDTVRMAACLGDGRAAGPKWTKWLLDEMRQVRGAGDFGIRDALPTDVAARTPIKNGWLLRGTDGNWHIACLAIGDGWALGVLVRYPGNLGFSHGAGICKSVATQLMK